MATVTEFLRRTPLARAMPNSAEWSAIGDAAIVARADQSERRGDLAIADLSPLCRLGFKGRDTIAAMKARGIAVEADPNRAFRQPDGGLCLVLSPNEVILLGTLDSANSKLTAMERLWRVEDGERTYLVPRRDSHAWLAVAGPASPHMLAKLCAIDLRPNKFADLGIAQTSVARLSAIVTRADRNGRTIYHLLADSASSTYLIDCLLDAAQEFRGTLIGLELLRS